MDGVAKVGLVVLAIFLGGLVLVASNLSRWLGADLSVTIEAIITSIALLGAMGFVHYYFQARLLTVISSLCALLWPTWWRVLDSIVFDGETMQNPLFPAEIPFWAEASTKWGIEIALLVVFLLFVNRPRGSYR